jgi:hypothetical protein
VERVTARQAVVALEIERRQHLAVADEIADARCIRLERGDDRIADCVASTLVVPRPIA